MCRQRVRQSSAQTVTDAAMCLQVVALGFIAASSTALVLTGAAGSHACHAFAMLPGSAGSSWLQLPLQPSSLQGAAVSTLLSNLWLVKSSL